MTFKLPEPLIYEGDNSPMYDAPKGYTAAQMHEAYKQGLDDAARVAQETVCDMHIPTGIKIYGTRAAKAIHALGS